MMKGKPQKRKLMWFVTMPLRALAKARDMYVRGMNNYGDKMCYAGAGWGTPAYAAPLPRSFSTTTARSVSEDEDFKELVRAASTGTLAGRIDLSSLHTTASSGTRTTANSGTRTTTSSTTSTTESSLQKSVFKGVPRSASVSVAGRHVGMAKIEEDQPCENFGDDVSNSQGNNKNKGISRLFPRSKSYAVGSTKKNPYAAVV